VTITTQQSRQAFRPANQADYNSADNGRRTAPQPSGAVESYPAPPPPYPYYYSPYYYYPGYYGYYGFYGYGPSIFVGPRVYMGGRSFHGHHH